MRILLPLLFIWLLSVPAWADIVYVSVSSPTSGSSHTSGTLSVAGSASDSAGVAITGWVITAKNNSTGSAVDIYKNSSAGSKLGTTVCFAGKIPAGNYTLIFKVWDTNGTLGTSTISNVNLSGSSCTSSTGGSGAPVPPSTAKTIYGIDGMSGWTAHTGAEAACPSGQACNPPIAKYTNEYYAANSNFGIPTIPGSDGKSAVFTLLKSPAWADLLYGKSLGAFDSYQNFKWDFWVYFKSTTYNNLEFDIWQSIGGYRYMMGSQCNTSAGTWDGWNEASQHWVHIYPSTSNNNLKCGKFSTNTWHHITWYTNRSNGTYGYIGLSVDGVYHPLGGTLPRYSPLKLNWSDNVGVQVQIDADGNGDALTEWVDSMNLTMW